MHLTSEWKLDRSRAKLLTNHVSYGKVHPEFAIEADSEQFKGSPHGWAWDTICTDSFAGSKETWFALPHLTLLGVSQDGDD